MLNSFQGMVSQNLIAIDIFTYLLLYIFLSISGILVSFLANYCLADVDGGWRVMFGVSAFAAIIQAVAMLFLPKVYSHAYKMLEHPFFVKIDNGNF